MSNYHCSAIPPPRSQPARLLRRLSPAWSCLPQARRQEVLLVLSQIIAAQSLPAAVRKDANHEHI